MKKINKTKKLTISKHTRVTAESSRKATSKKRFTAKNNKALKKPNNRFSFGGLIFVFVFLSAVGLSAIFSDVSNNDSVLGASTKTMAPMNFKAETKGYRVNLTWDNVVDGDYRYLVWVYDRENRKYEPKAFGSGSGSIGEIVSYDLDQIPGTSVLYRVSVCNDCRFSKEKGIIGSPGFLSSRATVNMPRIERPDSIVASADNTGVKLSWSPIVGVDGYEVWRSTFLLGLTGFRKIGFVGTLGTFSSYHVYEKDGEPKIPIDVISEATYLDEKVRPGVRYYYKISARKMIVPLTKPTAWQSTYGNRSSTISAVAEEVVEKKPDAEVDKNTETDTDIDTKTDKNPDSNKDTEADTDTESKKDKDSGADTKN